MNYLFEKILKNNKISKYLYSKGITPAKVGGSYSSYKCPLHPDNTPSFVLYGENDPSTHESFWCFGCKKGSTIIQLVAEMEFNGDKRKAIEKLSNGIDLSATGEIDFIISELSKEERVEKENPIDQVSLKLSVVGYRYIKETGFDKGEIEFMENFYKKIDDMVYSNDLESLKESYEWIVDSDVFSNRLSNFNLKNGIET